ncbi:MAG: excinuclease ABC subunit UvrC [Candidatus Aminicenantes bacterium]|nr:MAG: excinuclease ABC subunit UvrC [Candidatus Aminicenantes bacterium]
MSDKTKNSLRAKLDTFPKKPGIYFFKDKFQNIIYIGKARSLRDRVKSYFIPSTDAKVNNLLGETRDIEYILTGSEKEANFLENNFIQQYQPKFNLRLKDDKSFPYLKLSLQDRYPGIYLTRRVKADGSKYFGPFSPAHQARQTIHLISKFFGIRTCTEKLPGKRKRPCLEYDLKLCSAPCTEFISEIEYKENVNNARLFMEGKVDELLKIARAGMKESAEQQEFEQAAQWRDLIHTLENIKEEPKMISVGLDDKDIIGFAHQKDRTALYVFVMRKGKVSESESVLSKKIDKTSPTDPLSFHLSQFYKDRKNWPDKILLPCPPIHRQKLQDEISFLAKKSVKLMVPHKGKNRKLVELADRNAEIILKETSNGRLPLRETQEILDLERIPRRIEGFDVSNTGGEESVGSVVVFEEGHPRKQEYRKYKIKTVKGPDDVACLQEVIRRRYTRLKREKKALPDLILVDGGKGQLNIARKTLKQLGLENLPVISLAKRDEIIFAPSHSQGLKLDRTSPVLKLFQHIRDEAHRFAITYHRMKRDKRSFESKLDGIPGLGPKRKSLIFKKYRSLAEIKNSSLDELAKTVGSKIAVEILKILK